MPGNISASMVLIDGSEVSLSKCPRIQNAYYTHVMVAHRHTDTRTEPVHFFSFKACRLSTHTHTHTCTHTQIDCVFLFFKEILVAHRHTDTRTEPVHFFSFKACRLSTHTHTHTRIHTQIDCIFLFFKEILVAHRHTDTRRTSLLLFFQGMPAEHRQTGREREISC